MCMEVEQQNNSSSNSKMAAGLKSRSRNNNNNGDQQQPLISPRILLSSSSRRGADDDDDCNKNNKKRLSSVVGLLVTITIILAMSFFHLQPMMTLLQPASSKSSKTTTNQKHDNKLSNSKKKPADVVKNNKKIVKHIDIFINGYQKAIDSKINLQTASWFRHVGQYREELTADKARDETTSRLLSSSSSGQQKQSKEEEEELTPALKFDDSDMIWDNEENDISEYFKTIKNECTKDATTNTNKFFHDKCLKFVMHDLILEPRCTTRLDSRYKCIGNSKSSARNNRHLRNNNKKSLSSSSSKTAAPQVKELSIDTILGPDHLSEDTINLVILGGGPVGLYLANSLIKLQKQQKQRDQLQKRDEQKGPKYNLPEIRIVIFENRVFTEGHKKPYTRDWITGLALNIIFDLVDDRIMEILRILYKSNRPNTALPIRVWETLLLLSCRQMGVKFIYDDVQNYEDYLLEIPNLLMIDATGHRLSSLNRGENDDINNNNESDNDENETATTAVSIKNWSPNSPDAARLVQEYWRADFSILKKDGTPLKIANRISDKDGSILYPVKEDNKRPYDINMLKLMNLPNSDALDNILQNIKNENNEEMPYFWIGPHFGYTTYQDFRPDIRQVITQQKEYPHLSTRTLFIHLTDEQYYACEELVQQYSTDGKTNFLLTNIPINVIENNKVLKKNQVQDTLLAIMRFHITTTSNDINNGDGPTFSMFKYRPYMYSSGVVPNGYKTSGGTNIKMIRLGDSLFTGDPNANSGLESHMQLIYMWQCQLLTNHTCSYFYNR